MQTCPKCAAPRPFIDAKLPTRRRVSRAQNVQHVERIVVDRVRTLDDWDRAFAGEDGPGWPLGSRILVYGGEGTGKTSELLRVAAAIGVALYVTAEQQEAQIASYCARLKLRRDRLWVLHEQVHGAVCRELRTDVRAYRLGVIDSVQALTQRDGDPIVDLVRAVRRLRTASARVSSLVIVSQVNAAGEVAGPRKLKHEVDAVVELRAREIVVEKSRFGPPRTVERLNPRIVDEQTKKPARLSLV